jgi:hypothetical protein
LRIERTLFVGTSSALATSTTLANATLAATMVAAPTLPTAQCQLGTRAVVALVSQLTAIEARVHYARAAAAAGLHWIL